MFWLTGVYVRSLGVIRRRIYSVPNYIWHLDSHKLIRWHFIIHAAIDGFLRTIIYLKCADNIEQIQYQHLAYLIKSVPIKVEKMQMCGDSSHGNMSAVFTGSSVHNERIERLWRDVHHTVVSSNSAMFRNMEEKAYLTH